MINILLIRRLKTFNYCSAVYNNLESIFWDLEMKSNARMGFLKLKKLVYGKNSFKNDNNLDTKKKLTDLFSNDQILLQGRV